MNFLDRFSGEKTQVHNFTKICPVGAEFFHAEGADITKLREAFRNSADASKNAEEIQISVSNALVYIRQLCTTCLQ